MNSVWIVLGWVIVIVLPLAVVLAVILWPERTPKDRTVKAIRRRVEAEESGAATRNFQWLDLEKYD